MLMERGTHALLFFVDIPPVGLKYLWSLGVDGDTGAVSTLDP